MLTNTAFDIIAIASSAGGIAAVTEILSSLPGDFPAAIAIVQHLDPQSPSYLAQILSRRTKLQVKQAEPGELLTLGNVYVAAPNKHLLVNSERILYFSDTEKVCFSRPSADVLFSSVAAQFKERAIGLVLTGKDGDGATGVQAIKKMGGTVIAQDEATSEFFSMPKAAIETGCVDFILPLNQISATLVSLVITSVRL